MTWLQSCLSVVAVATLAGLVAPGCEENKSMLFIVGVLAIDDTECIAKAEREGPFRTGGTLDVSLRAGYRAPLLVGSHLTQRGSREQLRTETARLALEGAEVTLEAPGGQPLSIGTNNPFSTIGTGFVDAASAGEPAYGIMVIDLIPGSVSQTVYQQVRANGGEIVAKVRAFGTTLGGQEVESNEFSYPIQLCDGCLLNYGSLPQDGDDPNGPRCPDADQNSTATAGCVLGQDRKVDCQICSGSSSVCAYVCSNCAVRSVEANNAALCSGVPVPANCQ